MGHQLALVLVPIALFALFLWWYGGNGAPMDAAEQTRLLATLRQRLQGTPGEPLIEEAQQLLASEDGKEFVMHNCVRYRAKALYPPGSPYGDDPREADRRYGRAMVPHLLRRACVPVFIAKRSGRFIDCEGVPEWHYVAMVRYRSRRDFFAFVLAINAQGADVHKWAAIGQTVIFPVKPIVSLVVVRFTVGALFALVAAAVFVLTRIA
ncbi:MAG: hypothetical protein QE279_11640 [Rhodoferax sp.]|nr:hypothetical protein [Rhodoferax sp.]